MFWFFFHCIYDFSLPSHQVIIALSRGKYILEEYFTNHSVYSWRPYFKKKAKLLQKLNKLQLRCERALESPY